MSLRDRFSALETRLNQQVIGQPDLNRKLLIALLADGHLLVEGAPGLAKTRAVKALAEAIEADFHRVQFTPDLLPADLTGTEIYRPQDGSFVFQRGPLFHHLLLADEINRAPAKVQSALLEAMAERQITVGGETYALPRLFLVMATQNPIEQEGTYPLPEAQLDRFLLHVKVSYPDADSELAILRLARGEAQQQAPAVIERMSQHDIFAAREDVLALYMAPEVERYIVELVLATRSSARYSADLSRWIAYGASPRATIALDRCARAQAWLSGRDFVSPDDVQHVLADVLRHRLLLSYEAEAESIDAEHVVARLMTLVAAP
ncbi:MAG TPA: MoxR family ATPase [Permianibacter sp.]|nr:MoxR family ATPase [Permianibacter sp.]